MEEQGQDQELQMKRVDRRKKEGTKRVRNRRSSERRRRGKMEWKEIYRERKKSCRSGEEKEISLREKKKYSYGEKRYEGRCQGK